MKYGGDKGRRWTTNILYVVDKNIFFKEWNLKVLEPVKPNNRTGSWNNTVQTHLSPRLYCMLISGYGQMIDGGVT